MMDEESQKINEIQRKIKEGRWGDILNLHRYTADRLLPLAEAFRDPNCKLQELTLCDCGITNKQLLPLVEAFRGLTTLEELCLCINNIGNTGCRSLTTLLEDPSCSIKSLNIGNNNISNGEYFIRWIGKQYKVTET